MTYNGKDREPIYFTLSVTEQPEITTDLNVNYHKESHFINKAYLLVYTFNFIEL